MPKIQMIEGLKKELSEDQSKLRAEPASVGQTLFQGLPYYNVPYNQRGYRWGKKQIETMLEDIIDWHGIVKDEKKEYKRNPYFMGAIHLSATEELDVYDIIDGQQRLITIYLVIAYLYHKMMKYSPLEVTQGCRKLADCLKGYDATKPVFSNTNRTRIFTKYVISNEREETILGLIADQEPKKPDTEKEIGLLKYEKTKIDLEIENIVNKDKQSKSILEAYGIIEDYIKKEEFSKENLEKLAMAVLDTRFVRIESTSTSAALLAFDTMNNRGLDLTSIDIFKNYLFMFIKPESYEELGSRWEKIQNTINSINLENKNSNEDKMGSFFRSLTLAKYYEGTEYITIDELNSKLKEKKTKLNAKYTESIEVFVEEVINEANNYKNFLENKNCDGSRNIYLENIEAIDKKLELHIVLLISGSHLEQELFDYLCEEIEKVIAVHAIRSKTVENARYMFMALAKRIRKIRKDDFKELKKAIQEEFKIQKEDKVKEFKEAIRTIGKKISKDEKKIDYKSRKAIKYLLAKIYTDIEVEYGNVKESSIAEYMTEDWQIEHIAAQNRANAENEINKRFIDSLGNMTLLTLNDNAAAGRKSWKEKATEHYKSNKFLATKAIFEDMQIRGKSKGAKALKNLRTYTSWSEADIKNREDWIEEYALNILGLQEEQKNHNTLLHVIENNKQEEV